MTKPIASKNKAKRNNSGSQAASPGSKTPATISTLPLERRKDADTQSEFSVSDALKDRKN